jgi:hypothetical protein
MLNAIVVLLVISAVAELFGTVTVATNYARGHQLARSILDVVGETTTYGDIEQTNPRMKTLARHLEARPIYTAGLIAYGLGALTGLTAGLLAVCR